MPGQAAGRPDHSGLWRVGHRGHLRHLRPSPGQLLALPLPEARGEQPRCTERFRQISALALWIQGADGRRKPNFPIYDNFTVCRNIYFGGAPPDLHENTEGGSRDGAISSQHSTPGLSRILCVASLPQPHGCTHVRSLHNSCNLVSKNIRLRLPSSKRMRGHEHCDRLLLQILHGF